MVWSKYFLSLLLSIIIKLQLKNMLSTIKRFYFGCGYLLVASAFLLSCRANKDLQLIQDTWPTKKLSGMPGAHSDYKIKVNDNLFVSIISSNVDMNETYNPSIAGIGRAINNIWQTLPGQFLYGYLVDPDGTISLPSIGKVAVAGLTINECEIKVKAKAEEYLKGVIAKVRLLSYKITVMGEIANPGVYYNYNPEFTVFDALSAAGGLTPSAKLSKVLVLRRTDEGSKTITLNLNSYTTLESEAYFLEPNDVVIVPPAHYKNAQLSLPFYTALLSTVTTFLLILKVI
jgi:polysaccharide biosynthesis/export protein